MHIIRGENAMPQIFDEEGREKVRITLLESGFELIKTHGLKKTSISDITKSAGIATGTFYNFFDSKEDFVYQIMLYKRNQSKTLLSQMSKKGKIDKKNFKEYLITIYTSDYNVFEYLSESEIDRLKSRWPEEYWKNAGNEEATIKTMVAMLKSPRENLDWQILGNLFKSMALIGHGRDRLYTDKYKETVEIFVNAIVRFVFG